MRDVVEHLCVSYACVCVCLCVAGDQWPSRLGQVFSSGAWKPVVCYWICRQDHKGVDYESTKFTLKT